MPYSKVIVLGMVMSSWLLVGEDKVPELIDYTLCYENNKNLSCDEIIKSLGMGIKNVHRAVYNLTEITTQGSFTLAANVADQITITASNVTLDMNGHTVSGGTNGIVVADGLSNITIINGAIANVTSNGIHISPGCSDIVIEHVAIKNSDRAIFYEQSSNGMIRNCDMSLNTTAVECIESNNIFVVNCTANANVQAAFSLIESSTCTFINCHANATGKGNAAITDTVIAGFISQDGYGNIFQNCIANATQSLTTTDASSFVAGFALRGSETSTKITDCEAANATTSSAGVTVPYGIVLEASLDQVVTVTSINPNHGLANDQIYAVDWSPDGIYLAAGGELAQTSHQDLFIYRFDRVNGVLEQVDSDDPGSGDTDDAIRAVKWSPDGKYLAVGGTIVGSPAEDLFIYRFDRKTETLTLVYSTDPGTGNTGDTVYSVSWSPDGRYLAIGGAISGTPANDLIVYSFDRTTETLTVVDAVDPGSGDTGDSVYAVSWSPNGTYLAVGGEIHGTPANDLLIYKFDRSTQTLTEVDAVNPDQGGADIVYTLDWSYEGTYLAVGGEINGTTDDDLFIYQFDESTETLTDIVSLAVDEDTLGTIFTVKWSPDGNYLAVGGSLTGVTSDDFFLFQFDRGVEQLIPFQPGSSTRGEVDAISWSPDGAYMAVGAALSGGANDLLILTGLTFPGGNVVANNIVYGNSGNMYPGGIGISGSSISNLIIGNTAYNNSFNYLFVTNVFNQLFGEGPSVLQNIALKTNDPIVMPPDIPTTIKRTELLLESLIDNLL